MILLLALLLCGCAPRPAQTVERIDVALVYHYDFPATATRLKSAEWSQWVWRSDAPQLVWRGGR